MSDLARKLAAYEEMFKEHQTQVTKFYQAAENCFNDNKYFPSTRITRVKDGEGSLVTLGTDYEISFRFVVWDEGDAKGVLEVSLPAIGRKDSQRVGLWFVDQLGNVKKPGETFASNLIDNESFVVKLLDAVQQAHFALVKKSTAPT
jgi:hypothetical protein